jgi:hypothetical protein
MPFSNAFGVLPRRSAWLQLLATPLKKLTCSTSPTGGEPSQVAMKPTPNTSGSRESLGDEW